MVFLKMKIGCWVETEGLIHFMLCMYAALHFPKMHITQLFFNRVFWERTYGSLSKYKCTVNYYIVSQE